MHLYACRRPEASGGGRGGGQVLPLVLELQICDVILSYTIIFTHKTNLVSIQESVLDLIVTVDIATTKNNRSTMFTAIK